jgi:hypothetical protein
MSGSRELGTEFREFLRGLLDVPEAAARGDHVEKGPDRLGVEWGPRLDLTGLKDNYAPHKVEPFTATPGGIDNLVLRSTDTFTIPGMGEYTVDFSGYFRVARGNPTTTDWATCEVLVNMLDLKLVGQHKDLGEIRVSLNPDILSTGQIFPTAAAAAPHAVVAVGQQVKACRIATAAVFDIPQLGVSVFNKEPVLLMNENIKSIPPVDDPGGHALIFKLPLFNRKDPQGKPVAYLTSLRYGAENYITHAEAKAFQARS